MKIYISGKISGLPLSETKERFDDVQALLEAIGFEVVNPMKSSLPHSASWEEHMVKDIELLLPCEAIYMMDNWNESLGASIEYDIANRMKKYVYFESSFYQATQRIIEIQNAIYEITGMRMNDYATSSREHNQLYARMIFAYQCEKNNIRSNVVARILKKKFHSVKHMIKKYHEDYKYNQLFRLLAIQVDEKLKENHESQV